MFLMVIVSVDGWLIDTLLGLNPFVTLTPGRLVSEAAVGSGLVTPLNVVTTPAGIVFVRFALTDMTTRTVSVQVEFGGKTPPLKEKAESPGLPLNTPPQVPVLNTTGSVRCMPGSMLSVNAMPVSAVFTLGLIS